MAVGLSYAKYFLNCGLDVYVAFFLPAFLVLPSRFLLDRSRVNFPLEKPLQLHLASVSDKGSWSCSVFITLSSEEGDVEFFFSLALGRAMKIRFLEGAQTIPL